MFGFSNPNEPQDQDMLHKQEHGRFKNIEWTAYETVHKKYLSLGTLQHVITKHGFWWNLPARERFVLATVFQKAIFLVQG